MKRKITILILIILLINSCVKPNNELKKNQIEKNQTAAFTGAKSDKQYNDISTQKNFIDLYQIPITYDDNNIIYNLFLLKVTESESGKSSIYLLNNSLAIQLPGACNVKNEILLNDNAEVSWSVMAGGGGFAYKLKKSGEYIEFYIQSLDEFSQDYTSEFKQEHGFEFIPPQYELQGNIDLGNSNITNFKTINKCIEDINDELIVNKFKSLKNIKSGKNPTTSSS